MNVTYFTHAPAPAHTQVVVDRKRSYENMPLKPRPPEVATNVARAVCRGTEASLIIIIMRPKKR